MQTEKYFRIGEVAELIDEQVHTIRYWEKRFKIKPFRSLRCRAYSLSDLHRFENIRKLLRIEKYTIDGAIRRLKAR